MTTITVKKSGKTWTKTHFDDAGELLDYLLETYEVGKLKKLPEGQMTEQRKKDWEDVEKMDKDDFIDLR